MRSSTFAAALLSAGPLSLTGAAYAAVPTPVVLDTSTGNVSTSTTEFDSQTVEFTFNNGMPSGKLPERGIGFAVHANVTMSITDLWTAFAATNAQSPSQLIPSGVGHFVVSELASQKTEWLDTSNFGLDPQAGTVGKAHFGSNGPTLKRGKDYLIAYVAEAGSITLHAKYTSLEATAAMSGFLDPIGFGKVTLNTDLSNAVLKPSWKLDLPLPTTTSVPPLFPPFKVSAIIGDTDADTVADDVDNCIDDANQSQNDFDLDGVGDACDNCKSVYNPDQSSCSNGGGGMNPDGDGDGVLDVRDNCPFDPNPAQADSDHDGTGDACDGGEADTGCNALGASPSLLLALAALAIRRRRR